MKRSEAIELINEEISSYYGIKVPNDDELSHYILKALESKLRMTYPVPFGVWAHLDKDDPEYNIREVYIPVWEPEDESNTK